MTVKWRGKPVFIRHRTPAEISTAQADDNIELRDPQTDADRCKDPRYLGIFLDFVDNNLFSLCSPFL